MSDVAVEIRLDKWLWAARFFKTRKLAAEAVTGGKVHLNGQRCKPGKNIKIGSQLVISKNALEWDIEVAVIPKQRRPASEAVTFYTESDESQTKRQTLSEQIRLERAANPLRTEHRPTKRDRRLIHRFVRKSTE